MILHAATRPVNDTATEAHRFTIEADTYADGFAQARSSCPDGWQLLYVRTDH